MKLKMGRFGLFPLELNPSVSKLLKTSKPFTEGSEGKEFVKYELVKEVAMPKSTELESVKINYSNCNVEHR